MSSPLRTRLSLESLDARVVPATYWWQGWESTDPADPDNWGPPDGGPALPGIGDTLRYGPEVWTDPVTGLSRDCIGLSAPGGAFAEIRIGGGYTGKVELDGPVEVGDFTLTGGAVSQPNSGDDLTVTGAFTWTGGTLNSSSNLANVTITGSTATGLIAPTGGGTVNLGSSITIDGGAVVTAKEGTVNVTNESTVIKINANSGMLVDPGVGNNSEVASSGVPGGALLWVRTDAWFKVKSGDYLHAGVASLTGGSFILEGGTSATFRGSVDPFDPPTAPYYFYEQISGVTNIAADASLS